MQKIDWKIKAGIPLAFLGLVAGVVFAQNRPDSTAIVVSPPSFELTAAPGKVITNVIKVTNPSDKAIAVSTSSKDFVASGEEGSAAISEEDSSFSLAKWITVEPTTATILPKATANFTYTISVPKDAEPGGHFGTVLFRMGGEEKVSGSGAALASEIGSIILLNLTGKTKEEAKLISFEPLMKVKEYGPVSLEYRIQNKGNVHVKPVGEITIKDMLGRLVYEENVDPKNVLPASIRKNDFVWNKKWLFGKFRAKINLTYGSDKKVMTGETQFWVMPYKVIVAATVVLVLVITYLSKNGKRIKKALRLMAGKD